MKHHSYLLLSALTRSCSPELDPVMESRHSVVECRYFAKPASIIASWQRIIQIQQDKVIYIANIDIFRVQVQVHCTWALNNAK